MTTVRTRRPEHVVVVGGGIAGLTAAYRLTQAGCHVTIVEPDRLGGKLQTSMVAGRPIDESADAFLLRVPWALDLCRDLDLDGELVSPVARTAHVWVDGTRRTLPTGHVMGVPADLDALAVSGLLSPEGLARVAADLQLPADPADPALAGVDVAIGPYLRRRLGDEVVDHLIDPLIGGINAGDTAHLSLAAVVPQLDAAARSGDPSLIRSCAAQLARARAALAVDPTAPAGGARAAATTSDGAAGLAPGAEAGRPQDPPVFATPLGGMARIVDNLLALMPGADLRTGRRAEAVEPTATGARVVLDDGAVLDADAVVVACPAFAAAPLVAPFALEASRHLAAIDHASVTMITFAFDRASIVGDLDASGCLVPRDQGTLMTAVSYGTSKWAQWRDPERDDVLLRASAGRVGDDRQLDLDDAALTEQMLADLDRVLGLRGAPTEVRVGRWARSLPQYEPGHLDRVAAVEADLAAVPGSPVVVAGAAYRGLGVPACIQSGERAATALGARWPTPRR